MFKLLKNKPYNVVRGQCDRIGRQIYELSSKVKGGKAAEDNNRQYRLKPLLYQHLCLHYEVVKKEGRLTDAETVKVKMCVWRTSVQTVQDQKTILTVTAWRDKHYISIGVKGHTH